MLTVVDALQLNIFEGAQLIAGAQGTHRAIAWVHNSSVPDVHNWLDGGELVLTTARNMPQHSREQLAYIQALADRGVVGLVVTVGRDLDAVPAAWCEAADANALPLITLPYTTRFVQLARAVNERIVQDSVGMLRRALHIHQVVTRLVLDDGNLHDLARVLADLIGQSISVETERFDALASANTTAVDEARRYTLQYGRTNPLLIEALEAAGVLDRIRQTLRPVQLEKMPHVGLEMERILAPIVVHGEIYGYMWIIADGSPLGDLDQMAIESGSTVAALMMLHQEAVQTAEASLKGNLFSRLIEGDDERASVLNDHAMRYGLDMGQPYRMLLLDSDAVSADEGYAANGQAVRLYRRVNRLAAEQKWEALVGQFAGQVVLLLGEALGATAIAEHVFAHLDVPGLRLAISARHRTQAEAPKAYNECREALTIAHRLDDACPVVQFDELGYLHTLFHAGAGSLQSNPLVPSLERLQAETQADLFHTLEAYLDLGGNGVATAETLHIHRSTLNYRLQRISQIAGVDLTDPITRVNLQMTLKQMRLFGGV